MGVMNSDVVRPKGGLAQAIRADTMRESRRCAGGQAGFSKLVRVLKVCDDHDHDHDHDHGAKVQTA